MKIDLSKEKLQLEYPCEWLYKLIGADERAVRTAIAETITERSHTIANSNTSSNGKYQSLNLSLTVESDEDRTGIYQSLKNHPAIKMVL